MSDKKLKPGMGVFPPPPRGAGPEYGDKFANSPRAKADQKKADEAERAAREAKQRKVKGLKKGGSVSRRADGVARKGKTKGKVL